MESTQADTLRRGERVDAQSHGEGLIGLRMYKMMNYAAA